MKNLFIFCFLAVLFISAIQCDNLIENPSEQLDGVTIPITKQPNDNQRQQQDTTQLDNNLQQDKTRQQFDNQEIPPTQQDNKDNNAIPKLRGSQSAIDDLQYQKTILIKQYFDLQDQIRTVVHQIIKPDVSKDSLVVLRNELYPKYDYADLIQQRITYLQNKIDQLMNQ